MIIKFQSSKPSVRFVGRNLIVTITLSNYFTIECSAHDRRGTSILKYLVFLLWPFMRKVQREGGKLTHTFNT